MQQRRPRLGDVLDDYCPRERRVTNHVVVAMIEDEIRQTRCSTCDAEHEYKQARVPSPRRTKAVAALNDGDAKPVLAAPVRPSDESSPSSDADQSSVPQSEPPGAVPDEAPVPMAASSEGPGDEVRDEPMVEDDGPVHRPLIRAQLPRPEGHVPERKEPEFTIRQPGSRGGGGGREVDGNSVGYRPKGGPRQGGFGQGGGGGHSRFGGGQRHGSGQPQQRHGGGRGPSNQPRSGRPEGGVGNPRGQQRGPGSGPGPGSGRRRGGR